MTEPERQALRHLIDQAKRARILVCGWCGTEMLPHPTGYPKRFCRSQCRKSAWRAQTEKGRALERRLQREKKRRLRAAKAAA